MTAGIQTESDAVYKTDSPADMYRFELENVKMNERIIPIIAYLTIVSFPYFIINLTLMSEKNTPVNPAALLQNKTSFETVPHDYRNKHINAACDHNGCE